MELQTSRFGKLTITDNEIYIFAQGLPGFEEHKSFIVIAPEDDHPFAFLQSTEDEKLSFIITDPFLFFPDYDFEIPESALVELEIAEVDQVVVRSILSVRDGLETATINLVAPVIINLDNHKGKQVVLGGSTYTTRHELIDAKNR
ncbi:flagellar assembly protein FliW [Paenibacillus sp. CF384]|uniref:flagellar assembly protein FliW n=1 Tax=Paenibacillus sp. CF384 TaxID=1884382 RepID=UPI0008966C46|nr:flagellar assembly protein FliW [Paenibacillus sp. CF384]SDX28398.1 flagellar assembly factor FliW [Paenibacillus sp. CF384]